MYTWFSARANQSFQAKDKAQAEEDMEEVLEDLEENLEGYLFAGGCDDDRIEHKQQRIELARQDLEWRLIY